MCGLTSKIAPQECFMLSSNQLLNVLELRLHSSNSAPRNIYVQMLFCLDSTQEIYK